MDSSSNNTTWTKPIEGAVQDPFLRLYVKGEFVRSFRIFVGTIVAGRDPELAVVIDDPYVSRRHIQIEYQGENKLYLQDLKSHNGTYVNGKLVQRCPIGHGDRISIGNVEFIVSHPTYADSNIIPFPKVQTQTGTSIAFPPEDQVQPSHEKSLGSQPERPLEPPPISLREVIQTERVEKETGDTQKFSVPLPPTAPAIPRPHRPKITPIKKAKTKKWMGSFFNVFFVMVSSAGLAWFLFQKSGKFSWKVFVQNVSQRVESISSPKEVEKEPLLSEAPKVLKTPQPIVSKPGKPVEIKKPSPPVKRSKGKGTEMVKGFDRSIQNVMEGDLGAARQLVASSEGKNSKEVKEIDLESTQPLQIEVVLPSLPKRSLQKKITLEKKSYDPTRYQAMLREKMSGIESCYIMHAQGGEKGSISVWLTIQSNGQVRKSGIQSSTLRNERLEKCMVDYVLKVKMDPPPWDNYSASYTFHFGGAQKVQFG